MKMQGRYYNIARDTLTHFLGDDCLSMAGALAYFSVFSLPGLLVIIITLSGAIFGEEAARGEIRDQTQSMLGAEASQELENMIDASNNYKNKGVVATVIGIVSLVIGATGVFGQLQSALNKVWHVQPDPNKGGIKNFIKKRVMSFGMVAGLGFLLLVSLVVSALIALFSEMAGGWLGSDTSSALVEILHVAISLVVFAAIFAAVFKIMPDVVLTWRDVATGACVTSLVFAVGKTAIGLYIGNSNVASAYGAAGSLVVLLVWIYYSSVMLLFGAVFTYILFRESGKPLKAEHGAIVMEEEKHPAPKGEAPAPA